MYFLDFSIEGSKKIKAEMGTLAASRNKYLLYLCQYDVFSDTHLGMFLCNAIYVFITLNNATGGEHPW